MSLPIVVSQNAADAVAVCLGLQKSSAANSISDETNKSQHSKLRGKNGAKKHKTPYQRENKGNLKKQKNKRMHNIHAPMLNDVMLVGDSIAVRLARQKKVYAPKYMSLCYGGATVKSLTKSVVSCQTVEETVTVIIGMNNALKNENTSKPEILTLINELEKKGAKDIYLCTVPPICKNLHGKENQMIAALNTILKDIKAAASHIHVVDVYETFLSKDHTSVEEGMFTKFYHSGKEDLVHPNAVGLEAISSKLFEAIDSQMIG